MYCVKWGRYDAGSPLPDLGDEARQFWSFLPVHEPPLPEVRDFGWPDFGWPVGPIDRFILARMEEAGVRPAPPADRRTLLRRVTFDLTGLPPAIEDVIDNLGKAFLGSSISCARH